MDSIGEKENKDFIDIQQDALNKIGEKIENEKQAKTVNLKANVTTSYYKNIAFEVAMTISVFALGFFSHKFGVQFFGNRKV